MDDHPKPTDDSKGEPAEQRSGSDLPSQVESLLFVSDGPVTLGRLSEALDVAAYRVEQALELLEERCAGRGLRLERSDNAVQLVTAPDSAAAIERFLGLETKMRFTGAALETLAIVAYRQPVTRPEIEAIRGVDSDSVVRTLMRAGLVEELGRAPTVGRPVLLGTTFEFLHHFGLSSLDELPPLEDNEDEPNRGD